MFSNCLHTTGHYNSATDTWDCTACGKVWAKKPYCARCGCEEGQTCNAPYKCPCHQSSKRDEPCHHNNDPAICPASICKAKRELAKVEESEPCGHRGGIFKVGNEIMPCLHCEANKLLEKQREGRDYYTQQEVDERLLPFLTYLRGQVTAKAEEHQWRKALLNALQTELSWISFDGLRKIFT